MQLVHEDPACTAPSLYKAYNILLLQQYLIVDQQADAQATAQHQDVMQFEMAFTQFTEEVRLAIK